MVIGIGKYPSIYLFEGNKDMKKLILPIFIAIITIVAVVTFQVQYSKYVQYKEQQEELKLIEQQKKETKKTMEEAEKKEANLDSLWQHIVSIHKKEITLPIKYKDFCDALSGEIAQQLNDRIVLKDGESLYLNFVSAGKDSRKLKNSTIYGISTETNLKSSWLKIQDIKVGADTDHIIDLYDQPVTNDSSGNPPYMQYADPKSDMLLDDQNITLYYNNDLISGISIYYDPSKDVEE